MTSPGETKTVQLNYKLYCKYPLLQICQLVKPFCHQTGEPEDTHNSKDSEIVGLFYTRFIHLKEIWLNSSVPYLTKIKQNKTHDAISQLGMKQVQCIKK